MKKILCALISAALIVALVPCAFAASGLTREYVRGYFGREEGGVREFRFTYIYLYRGNRSNASSVSFLTLEVNPEFGEKYPELVTGRIGLAEDGKAPWESGSTPLVLLDGDGNAAGTVSMTRYYYVYLRKVLIGDGIVSLPEGAFEGYSRMREATFVTDVLEEIPDRCFKGTRLEKVWTRETSPGETPAALDDYFVLNGEGESAISDSIPVSVVRIGESALEGCGELGLFPLHEGIREIGKSAFRSSGVRELYVPSTLGAIGDAQFSCMQGLEEVTVAPGIASVGYRAFTNDASLRSVTFGEGLVSIEEEAFRRCASLVSVNLPSTVSEIGERAFKACRYLKNVSVPEGVTELKSGVFSGCSSLRTASLPESLSSICGEAFYGCSSLEAVNIPRAVRRIGSAAFGKCSSLGSVSIPEGVTRIEDRTFYGCSSLAGVSIPESVTRVENSAFSGCSSLVSVRLPEGLVSIGSECFYECSSLSSVNIPASLKMIGKYAFARCFALDSLSVPSVKTLIGRHAYGFVYSADDDGFGAFRTLPVTLCGEAGSRAEEYAEKMGIEFIEE